MSAPGIGKESHLTLPDLSAVTRLPKPVKALVYLLILSVMTVAALGALAATIVILGQLTGAFSLL
ncbi:hypothetical protein A8924_1909 [Saccharopolyspora erythraea NRRL 2338]|uniref:Uncharacterized protein n=2 Tax=Saccharopolyspora erythraea TaxID=1836 RepID=A4F9V7_SACEN|nr:hypothetical protein [Saccharopolyspora erythraea]EQD83575.1 hypothetical protein N599_24460 [Saccharopolyspora erythraea D]PFG94620.1 hypothetical protein A8924_1909 [Saccharopolyspora erythraea NRRL 2338]QRK91353.1 hypothetical protein JQX30_08105 [Saccharopolyspora erythraea]CAM00832.1 hypothetical protein SACE_1510 [Saccharopolyspora erythraea NRRL 2338]